ncbi:MAG TPA: hypothetical protein VMV46_20695 [Thermoanaerobaculia bacterium]|nr:hypothetical protein [Thermoanaerobaculia bacterium]
MTTPVLFVPGLPGTHLHERDATVADQRGTKIFVNPVLFLPNSQRKREVAGLLEGPADLNAAPDPVVSGEPVAVALQLLFFDLVKRAQSLYDTVRGLGASIEGFGWDWRRPVWDAPMLARLEARVRALAADPANPTGQVTLIAHSTGGLVVRRLLEERHAAHDAAFLQLVRRVIGFGVPWAGTLMPVPFLLGERGFALVSKAISQRILARSWAAWDLLPPSHDPVGGADLSDAGGLLGFALREAQQVGLAADTGWCRAASGGDQALEDAMKLRAARSAQELGGRRRAWSVPVELVNVVGWGEPTIVACDLKTSSGGERLEIADDSSREGDGTVPRRSAAWIQGDGAGPVHTFHVPVGVYESIEQRKHSSLWRTPGGKELLSRVLAGTPPVRRLYAAADAKESNDGNRRFVTIHLHACDAGETPLPGLAARAFGANQTIGIPGTATLPLGGGRFAVQVPRERMQEVPIGSNPPKFRRFTLEVSWTGAPAAQQFPFLVR